VIRRTKDSELIRGFEQRIQVYLLRSVLPTFSCLQDFTIGRKGREGRILPTFFRRVSTYDTNAGLSNLCLILILAIPHSFVPPHDPHHSEYPYSIHTSNIHPPHSFSSRIVGRNLCELYVVTKYSRLEGSVLIERLSTDNWPCF
jgi:hypothetical protein